MICFNDNTPEKQLFKLELETILVFGVGSGQDARDRVETKRSGRDREKCSSFRDIPKKENFMIISLKFTIDIKERVLHLDIIAIYVYLAPFKI